MSATAPDAEWEADMKQNEAEVASLNEQFANLNAAFLETEDEETEEVEDANVGNPIMSGHCLFPQTHEPHLSHERCAKMGAGVETRATAVWHPCPDICHLGEEYECGNCGEPIFEAPYWRGDGVLTYVHVRDGRSIGEECTSIPRSS